MKVRQRMKEGRGGEETDEVSTEMVLKKEDR